MNIWFNSDCNRDMSTVSEVSLDKQTLLDIKIAKEAAQVVNNILCERVQELNDAYYAEFGHIRPEFPNHLLVTVPKWKQGLRKEQITQAMRDERIRICEHNAAVAQKYWEEIQALDDIRNKHITDSLNLPEDFNFFDLRHQEDRWEIEERDLV